MNKREVCVFARDGKFYWYESTGTRLFWNRRVRNQKKDVHGPFAGRHEAVIDAFRRVRWPELYNLVLFGANTNSGKNRRFTVVDLREETHERARNKSALTLFYAEARRMDRTSGTEVFEIDRAELYGANSAEEFVLTYWDLLDPTTYLVSDFCFPWTWVAYTMDEVDKAWSE